jgi:hypothetical protein
MGYSYCTSFGCACTISGTCLRTLGIDAHWESTHENFACRKLSPLAICQQHKHCLLVLFGVTTSRRPAIPTEDVI